MPRVPVRQGLFRRPIGFPMKDCRLLPEGTLREKHADGDVAIYHQLREVLKKDFYDEPNRLTA
jgi:hypothetical protein